MAAENLSGGCSIRSGGAATNVKTTGHDKVVIVRVGEQNVKVRRN